MKINSINSYIETIKHPAIKKEQKEKADNTVTDIQPQNVIPYRTYYNISFGATPQNENEFYFERNSKGHKIALCKDTTVCNNEPVTMSVNMYIAKMLFQNNEGEYDREKVKKFFEIYKEILEEDINDARTPRNEDSIKNIKDKLKPVIKSIDEMFQSQPASYFSQGASESATIQFLIETASDFKADKTKVKSLLETILYTNSLIGNDSFKYSCDILRNSRNEKNDLDFDFAEKLCDVARSFEDGTPNIDLIANTLKKFIEVDPEQKDNIILYFSLLATRKNIRTQQESFIKSFAYAFNEKTHKFDWQKADLMLDVLDETFKYLDLSQTSSKYYKNFEQTEDTILQKYFQANTDKITGKINSTYIAPQFFIYALLKSGSNNQES